MIYVIQGQEEIFIREKIAELISGIDDVVRFDGSDKALSIDEMIEACESNSLFSQKTAVLVDRPYFLIKKTEDRQLERLYAYISNPVHDTDLIFYTLENSFSRRLKAYKTVCENAQVIVLDQLDSKVFSNYARKRINEERPDLNRESSYMLINLCKRSATLLDRNLEVLKLYPESITPEVIRKLCTESDDNDVFEMINALTDRNVSKAISAFRKLMELNDSVYSVMGLLANQLRFLYHVGYLSSQGKRKSEIIEITSSGSYRIDRSLESLEKLKMSKILELLYRLSAIDIAIKSDSSVPEETRFELFILDLLQKGNNAVN